LTASQKCTSNAFEKRKQSTKERNSWNGFPNKEKGRFEGEGLGIGRLGGKKGHEGGRNRNDYFALEDGIVRGAGEGEDSSLRGRFCQRELDGSDEPFDQHMIRLKGGHKGLMGEKVRLAGKRVACRYRMNAESMRLLL